MSHEDHEPKPSTADGTHGAGAGAGTSIPGTIDPGIAAVGEEHLPAGIVTTPEERRDQWFVGSIDQGTTSSRFLIFNGQGDPVASHQIEFENLYPESG